MRTYLKLDKKITDINNITSKVTEINFNHSQTYDEMSKNFDKRVDNLDKAVFETDFMQYEEQPINTEIKISESKAKIIAEKGFREGERIWGDCEVFDSISMLEMNCNNAFTRKNTERDNQYSKRKVYVITKYEDEFKMNGASIYVDVTTGKITGGNAFGD